MERKRSKKHKNRAERREKERCEGQGKGEWREGEESVEGEKEHSKRTTGVQIY